MSIEYSESATGERTGFSPLMCTAGQFFVDVWPARYDQTAVAATSSASQMRGVAVLPAGNAEVTVDSVLVMRASGMVALALATAGCPRTFGDDCTTDDDCGGGHVCARNRQCLPPDQIDAVDIRWTVDGMAASATTCAGI